MACVKMRARIQSICVRLSQANRAREIYGVSMLYRSARACSNASKLNDLVQYDRKTRSIRCSEFRKILVGFTLFDVLCFIRAGSVDLSFDKLLVLGDAGIAICTFNGLQPIPN